MIAVSVVAITAAAPLRRESRWSWRKYSGTTQTPSAVSTTRASQTAHTAASTSGDLMGGTDAGEERALMNGPTILLIDEPASALDHDRGAAVVDLITRLTHQQATATILVTHDRTHLTAADQIAEVHDGRLHLPAAAAEQKGPLR